MVQSYCVDGAAQTLTSPFFRLVCHQSLIK